MNVEAIKSAITARLGEQKDKLAQAQKQLNDFVKALPGRVADVVEELEIEKAIVQEELETELKNSVVSPNKIARADLEVRKATRALNDAVETAVAACYSSMAKAVEKGDLATFVNLNTLVGELNAGSYDGKVSVANEVRAVKAAQDRLDYLKSYESSDVRHLKGKIADLEKQISALKSVTPTA